MNIVRPEDLDHVTLSAFNGRGSKRVREEARRQPRVSVRIPEDHNTVAVLEKTREEIAMRVSSEA